MTDLTERMMRPGDPGYDAARAVWNAMVDRRPRLIAPCASVGDVVAAVRMARDAGLEIGVRCGGHNILGLAVPDDGLMVDLRPLSRVTVDPAARTARVEGGALLGALDRATQPYGLATTAGNVSHTGVGGLTLGGGMGWLARRHGLTCDNVLSFELVTADGEVVTASPTEHPDLFWGLRGGGGNFGIVTGFTFRLHDVGTRALVASFDYPLDRAADAMATWRDLAAIAAREATFTADAGGDGVASFGFVWVGDPAAGRRLLPAFADLGPAVASDVREMSYLDLQTYQDTTAQAYALRRYWKGHYLRSLPAGAIEAFLARGDGGPLAPAVALQAYGGAIADVPDGDAAFAQRETAFEYVAAARWTDAAEDADRIAAARRAGAGLEPYAAGAYVNTLVDEGAAGVRRAFPAAKLARLRALKARWDPENVFHLNNNITPAQAGNS
jgi:FAD/FMN-containing dehydrogenase